MSSSCAATLPHRVTTPRCSSVNKLNPTLKVHSYRSRCGLSRRNFATKGIVVVGASVMPSTLAPEPAQGLERLPFKNDGYKFWTWRGHKIHYVEQGEGFPIVLIHGFGASAFHWRYNIPELAKKYKVYAVDLLGFGWSEKALVDYDALVWRDQVADFLKEIVKEPTVLVGNSLGGFTALVAAEAMQQQVVGIALLNSAGQFGNTDDATTTEVEESPLQKFLLKPLKDVFQRVVLGFLFWQAKQPARVESVLKSVYKNTSNVDDYLIKSIIRPTDDPNAGEVYYRLMTRFMSNQRKYTLNSVLSKLSCPLLLVWGDLDPWVGPGKATSIKEFYPNTSIVNLQAGHCPHDEVPELVNKALVDWLSALPSTSIAPQIIQNIKYQNLPKGNIVSFNELGSIWESKIGKTLEKTYVSEEQLLKNIQDTIRPFQLNKYNSISCRGLVVLNKLFVSAEAPFGLRQLIMSILHAVFINGCTTNFEIEPSFGVEASELYPEFKFTSIDEYLTNMA